MGSCEDSCRVASEQHLCLEIEGKLNLGGGESDPAGDVDGILGLGRSGDGNAGCLSHLDGSVEENRDGDCLVLEELVMGDECGVKRRPASAVDGSLELFLSDDGNAGCLSREGGVKKIEGVDGRLGSVVKSRNGVLEGSVLGEEYGVRARCLGSWQNGSGGDSFGSQELCPEKVESGDEPYARMVDSLEDSVDVTAVSRSLGSSDQQGEANTDEELREQGENLAAMKADTNKLKVPSMGFEMCAKLGPCNGLAESVLEQETPDSASNAESSKVVAALNVKIICSLCVDGGHGVLGVMKEKSDAKMEPVPCNHLLSTQNFEASSNTEPSSCSPCELVKQHEKTGKGINHPSSDIQNVVEEEIEHCIEVSSPQACSGTLEALPLADSPNNFASESELMDCRSFSGPFVDSLSVAVVGNIDVSTIDTKLATCSSTLCSKEKCFDLEEALPERAANYFVEKTVPKESYWPLDVAEDDLSNMNSCVAAEFSGQLDKEGRHYARPDCLSESSRPLVSSSSSQGRKQGRKTSQKTQKRRAVGQCRNGIPDLDLSGHLESFMSVRRKRSSFSKPHRASTWGLLGITHLFMPSNGCESNQIQSHVSRNVSCLGSGKQNNIGAGSYSRKLDAKSSLTRIRLKVKLGNETNKRSMNIINTNIIHASESVCNGAMDSYHRTSSGILSPVHVVQDRVEDEKSAKQLLPLEDKMEKFKTSSDGSMVDFFTTNKDAEGTMVSAVSVGDAAEDYLRASSHLEVGILEATKQERDADPATSPDSEVSNFFPSGQLRMRCHKNCSSNTVFSFERGEDKCTTSQRGGCFLEDGSSNAFDMNKVKPLKKRVGRLESAGDICFDDILASSASGNGSSNSSSIKGLSPEQIPYSAEPEIEVLRETSQVERGTEAQVCDSLKGDHSASELQNSETLLPLAKSEGRRLQRKSDGVSKRPAFAAPKSRQCNDNKKKGNQQNSTNMNKLKEKGILDHILTKENGAETGDGITSVIGQDNSDDSLAFIDVADASITTSTITEKGLPVDNAWVRCDDCHKWRRISEELADSIGQTNCRWICEDNMDKAFSNCSVPQEMSNAEINAELGLPNADEVFDIFLNGVVSECSRATAYKEYEFLRISTNQFLHRSRKSQTIDEIMVCGCKPPQDGRLGCRDGCLNLMLNIECIQGTCPCGDFCSNQQFQRRSYAKMRWDRCGKKGFGLRLEEDICRGQFLIEYVGEVLDMRTYQARLKEYASRGHKHFYFMTLSSSEVIDASAKGNLGRFINHSCDPNCRTEKWVVNGEICIGLFALRDIKKGEEVTFDYNYVRVVGAAAKKCYCGSLQCRGFIGGDPTNAEIIDQVDSDEEFPEPVMLEEGEIGNVSKDRTTGTTSSEGVKMQVYESLSVDGSFMAKSNGATHTEVVTSKIEDSKNLSAVVSQLHTSMDLDGLKSPVSPTGPVDIPLKVENVSSRPMSSVQPEICGENIRNKIYATQSEVVPLTPLLTKVSSDCTVDAKKCKSAASGEKRVFVKSRFYIKTPGQSGILKKGKHNANQSNSRKVKDTPNGSETHSLRPKTFFEGVANCRFETVEEKLNELLDNDGGISKRKDSPRGFLQLLHLIAASGSIGNGETIQSNRELSMILDAILKTKSRMVLIDIINKNVLQKLHNMMKKCRRDFKKLPILRKVLKVLEYLAIREALTLEHISKGPPHPGVESFIESMLSLTEHDDKQVHQIARSFRDRWIPRHVRKICYLDRDEGWTRFCGGQNIKVPGSRNHLQDHDIRLTEALDTLRQPELPTTPVDANVNLNCSASSAGSGAKTRKRKTRWDQDKPLWISTHCDEQKAEFPLEQVSESKESHNVAEETLGQVEMLRENVCCPQTTCDVDNGNPNNLEDVPPGFSSTPSKTTSSFSPSTVLHMLQQATPEDLVIGHLQKKFISRFPVSYGIPLPIVQQLGSTQAEIVESCVIAPGIAFRPFPPLPPIPHPNKETSSCFANSISTGGASDHQRGSHNPATSYATENSPSTSGTNPSGIDNPGSNGQQAFKRPRGSLHDLGRRYFRQHKWHKMPLPWIRNGTRWGYSGNNFRGGMCARNMGNAAKQHIDLAFSNDVSYRVDTIGNYFNQQSQQLNDHS